MAWRRLLLPNLAALPVLVALLALGTWQVQRLAWKTDLLARMDAAETAPPVPLSDTAAPWMRVAATGRFDHAREARLGIEVRGNVLGSHLITPLMRDGQPPLLVDRGWVPLEGSAPIARPDGEQTVIGYLRPGEQAGWLAARDDPAGRRFYTSDPQAIAAALGIAAPAPYVLVTLGEGQGLPQPDRTIPRPANNHLGYAITWYGLAVSLVGVLIAFAWGIGASVEEREMRMPNAAYGRLKARFARIATLGECAAMLHWDASAMMPPGGAEARGEQLATLAGLSHEMLTAPEVEEDIELADPMETWDQANLALMARTHARATALPTELVEATTRANSACEKVWREAKAKADFALVRPWLQEVVKLQRETAQAYAAALSMDPYDALMDGYQRGVTAADVEPVFAAYEAFLRDALPRAEELQARRPAAVRPRGPFPVPVQRALCQALSRRIGLDYDHARLDESLHPFCGGTPTDVRITTFYSENGFEKSLLGVLHETGHALYERGLPTDFAHQPVGEAAGMAAHESQSLIVEMQACRSDAFLSFLGPELLKAFGGDAAVYRTENLARMWRHVERGFIRVDADELTYPAHVILRFRLERALIRGDLALADLPGAWNDGMTSLLGITPPDDAKGCLQDIHWYDGGFGYFPSYTLGAMAAAQLMKAARAATPGLDDAMTRGDLSPLLGWLRVNVHAKGSLLGFQDLLAAATGKPLDPADFQAHLRARYLEG